MSGAPSSYCHPFLVSKGGIFSVARTEGSDFCIGVQLQPYCPGSIFPHCGTRGQCSRVFVPARVRI